jgi:carbamoyl-phosphate synthase large subunit
MEHIELAGIHSGDSACVIPSRTISPELIETVEKYTDMIAKELNVVGIINIQYAVYKDRVYVLEANPRASRTVPVISKVLGITLASIATKLMLGAKLQDFPELVKRKIPYMGVKEAVFPFNMFPEVDPLLGPEMRATGEVMGIADTFGAAFYKAQLSTGAKLPTSGNILLTVNNRDKHGLLPIAKRIAKLGFTIVATEGTSAFLLNHGVPNTRINKLTEGRPNILDAIKDRELHLIINTPLGRDSKDDDSFIRMEAIQHKIPYVTTIAAAKASVEGIEAVINREILPVSLQEYFRR